MRKRDTIAAFPGIMLLLLLFVAPCVGTDDRMAEYVDGYWVVDGKRLTLIWLTPPSVPSYPVEVVDLGSFFGVIEQALKTSEVITIGYKPEDDSFPCKIILEFQGEKAEVQPLGIRITIQISGVIEPGTADLYGPYSSNVAIQVSVTWTPTDQVLDVICFDAATGQGTGYRLTGGSGFASFSTDWTKKYYVLIGNPSPPNTKTITYSGTIFRYIW